MTPRRKIILIVEAASAYGRGCLRGIARYARAHGGWTFFYATRYLVERANVKKLLAWDADGIIARIEDDHILDVVRKLNLPTVDISGPVPISGVNGVYTDDAKVIRTAADHLLSNGLKRIAFVGYPGISFSDCRQQVLLEMPLGARVEKFFFKPPPLRTRAATGRTYEARGVADADALAEWLRMLPKPVGVIACNDTRGRQVLQACAAGQVKVPYDVSVVGVDDDEVLCELAHPTLTSVAPNVETVGYEAAHLLDNILAGSQPPVQKAPLFIAPSAIEVRGSSDVMALTTPLLVSAVRFIRSRVNQGVNVKEVLAELHVSRSTLERLFQEHLGCTPYDYILRCRIERLRQLLVDTNYPLTRITTMAGLRSVAHMTELFRKSTGVTPAQYRLDNG